MPLLQFLSRAIPAGNPRFQDGEGTGHGELAERRLTDDRNDQAFATLLAVGALLITGCDNSNQDEASDDEVQQEQTENTEGNQGNEDAEEASGNSGDQDD